MDDPENSTNVNNDGSNRYANFEDPGLQTNSAPELNYHDRNQNNGRQWPPRNDFANQQPTGSYQNIPPSTQNYHPNGNQTNQQFNPGHQPHGNYDDNARHQNTNPHRQQYDNSQNDNRQQNYNDAQRGHHSSSQSIDSNQNIMRLVELLGNQAVNGRSFNSSDIPIFNGDIREWKPFITTFDAAVNGSNLSPLRKLKLLRSKLAGPALQAIASLDVDEYNYAPARRVLEGRFDNKRKVIEANIYTLKNLPPWKDDPESILRFQQTFCCAHDNLRGMVRSRDVQDFEQLLEAEWFYNVYRQMNPRSRQAFEQSLGWDRKNEIPNLTRLIAFVEHEYNVYKSLDDSYQQPRETHRKDGDHRAPQQQTRGPTLDGST